MNILKNKLIRFLFSSPSYPLIVQVVLFFCFAALIYGGIVIPDVDENLVKILRNTNFASLFVWSLWWPLIILSAIFFGRVWCQVCPMELVNSLMSKIGLRKKVPLFFKSGWIISIFYTLILIVIIHTLWAHRYPRRMAFYLLLLFGMTIIFGLIYEKRAFCNYVCPVGHLLGLYALCSPVEWRAKDLNLCKECHTKDCIAPENYYSLKKRSCTSNLYPATIKDNRRCLLCTQCLKVCPYGNLRMSLRRPMADFFCKLRLSNSELFFIFIVSGFVIHEIYVEWAAAKSVLFYVPAWINSLLGLSSEPSYLLRGFVLFIVLPTLLFLVPSALAKTFGKISLIDAAKKYSILILPVIAAGHVMKSLFKITSRIPYYEFLSGEPLGWNTAQLISSGQIQLDKSFISFISPFLSFIAVFLFAGSLIFSSVLLWKGSGSKLQSKGEKLSLFIGLIIYALIYIVMIFLWRF